MVDKKRGVLLILIKSKDEFSYGFPLLEEAKTTEENIATYDVDNYSESLVLQMAERFVEELEESIMVIVENEENLEINGITRLLANLSKAAKKPSKTFYLGKNEGVLRFSHWLAIQQVSTENDLKLELASWINER